MARAMDTMSRTCDRTALCRRNASDSKEIPSVLHCASGDERVTTRGFSSIYADDDVSTSREDMEVETPVDEVEDEEDCLPNVLGVDSMRVMHT